jgi:hypothetical protein
MRWVLVGVALVGCGRIGFSTQDAATPSESVPADSAPDAPPHVIESVSVPGLGTSVSSTMTLAAGVTYRLRASGIYTIGGGTDGLGDAEFWDFAGGEKDLCDDAFTDAGLAIDDPIVDGAKAPKWGGYRIDHVYESDFVGKGAPISATIHDVSPGNNSGSLMLEILAF